MDFPYGETEIAYLRARDLKLGAAMERIGPIQMCIRDSLWDTSSLMAARAGFRYSRGSNLSGCSAMNLRMVPVMARRRSESMLILHTALRAASVSYTHLGKALSKPCPPLLLFIHVIQFPEKNLSAFGLFYSCLLKCTMINF